MRAMFVEWINLKANFILGSLGILEFTVLYDASQKVLRVRVIRAQVIFTYK